MQQQLPHPVFGEYRALSNPIKLDSTRLEARCANALGADNDDILGRELGIDNLDALRSAGVI